MQKWGFVRVFQGCTGVINYLFGNGKVRALHCGLEPSIWPGSKG